MPPLRSILYQVCERNARLVERTGDAVPHEPHAVFSCDIASPIMEEENGCCIVEFP
jgi:hypothetical protein